MEWMTRTFSYLLPNHCVLCGWRAGSILNLCDGCAGDLPLNTTCCPICAVPALHAGPCARCLHRPPPFLTASCPFLYDGGIRYLVTLAKFNGSLMAVHALGALLAAHLSQEVGGLPRSIIPVPLHRARLRQRGFNQALELARIVGKSLDLPVRSDLCHRVRNTRPQSELMDARQRVRNVRGAFAVREGAPPSVAIVDDVMTTGATIEEMSRTLRRSGVRDIAIWACCRTTYQVKSSG